MEESSNRNLDIAWETPGVVGIVHAGLYELTYVTLSRLDRMGFSRSSDVVVKGLACILIHEQLPSDSRNYLIKSINGGNFVFH